MENQLLTRKQTAAIFGIKPRTIWHWERNGVIKPALYVRGRPRYSLQDINKVATDRQNSYHYKQAATDGE